MLRRLRARLALLTGVVLSLAALEPAATEAVNFAGPANFSAGTRPESVAVGDFNGDSDPDLATANRDSDDVSVLLGGAGGSFTGPTNFSAGTQPYWVAVGDFNGDSDPDLAVANFLSNTVSVLVGGAGGSFTGPTDLSVCCAPRAIAVGDFNGDSDPDLATANFFSCNVSVLLGSTGSSFAAPTNTSVGCGSPVSIAAGDFNGDSDPDLAVSNLTTSNVSVLTGGAGGSFSGPTNFSAGTQPTSVAVGNFNGDSDPDLGVANEGSNDVSVLLGGAGASFTGPTNVGGFNAPESLAVGQFNADSDPDLAVANCACLTGGTASASILLGAAGGSFTGPTHFPAAPSAGPDAVAVGDFNADSDPDLVVSNLFGNNVSVLLAANPPVAPTLTGTDPASPANDNSPEVKGSAQPGTTVQVYKASTTSDCTAGNLVATGSAAQFASPGLSASVADDSTATFRATATDADGTSDCSTSSITYVEDSTAPTDPTLSSPSHSVGVASNDSTVDVEWSGASDSSSGVDGFSFVWDTTADTLPDTVKDAEETATGTTSPLLSDGASHFLHLRTRDNAGNWTGTVHLGPFVIDTDSPDAPTLTHTVPESPANDNSPKVRGSAEAGSTVKLYTSSDCSGSYAATGSAASYGSPGLAVSVADDSTTTFRATATDAAGNTSACSTGSIAYTEDSTAPAGPTLTDTDPDSPGNDNSPEVKGTAAAGSIVRLYKAATASDCTAGNLAATGTAAELASPGLTASVADNSTTRFRATATDAAGNTSPCSTSSRLYTEDSTPPAGPVLTDTEPDSPANDNSPEVKGTAATGSTVRIYKAPTTSDCTAGNLAATGTAAELASPGLTVSVPDNSVTRFRATATDAAGNTSPCSASSRLYTEDSAPPAVPTVLDTDPDSPANDNSPEVNGTAPAGSTVRLYRASTTADCTPGNLVGTGTAAEFASTGISASVADNSITRFRATATDAAGNTSPCSTSSRLYTEDSTPPQLPTLTDTDPDSPADDNFPEVKGGAVAASATVRLYTISDCSGTVAASGSGAQFTSPGLTVSVPDNSTTTFYATATDPAGNPSGCSASSITYVEESIGQLTQPAGTAACVSHTGSAGACVDGKALDRASSVAVSPDGTSVYVASQLSDALARFDRDTTSGALTQPTGTAGCISETGTAGSCTDGRALDGASSVAVSADGTSVYVASTVSDAVARFDRDTATGALTQPAGTGGCVSETGTGGACVDGKALDGATSLAVSADGTSVYVASMVSDAVARFARATSGAVTQPAGTGGCMSETGTGGACVDGRALDGAFSVTVSADGKSLYAASQMSDAVARFIRNTTSGAITQPAGTGGCASETGTGGSCVDATALDGASSVAVSADGKSVYAASRASDAVAHFTRNTTNGMLTQPAGSAGCVSESGTAGACADGIALDGATALALSADDTSLYVASMTSDAVAALARNAGTGELTQLFGTGACVSETGTAGACTDGTALDGAFSVAVSAEGSSAYVASQVSDAVARFARDP